MAAKKDNVLLENAFSQFDEVVKQFLDTVPKQLNAPKLDPPGGKKEQIKPLPFNPVGGI